jgi:hypothetical protein
MSHKIATDTPLTKLTIGLPELLLPRHPLAFMYVIACAALLSAAAIDYTHRMTTDLAFAGQATINREITLSILGALLAGKLLLVGPAHELLHAWQMTRAGIPWDQIRTKLLAFGNAWVSAPNFAIPYREAIPILLTPIALVPIFLFLTLLTSPYHFGFVLLAIGATVGPINDVAIASRLWELHRTDPHVHLVERMNQKSQPQPYWTSLPD